MDNVLSLLGLIYRANKLYLGETCLDNISKVRFLFIASDASDNTKERYLKKCKYYNIPYNLDYPGKDLSNALGKNNIKVIGVFDKGFANVLLNKFKKEED